MGAQLGIVIDNQPRNTVVGMSGAQTVNILMISIGAQDGQLILDALNAGQQIYITLTGSGPCIKTEADAIRNIIAASTWRERNIYGGLHFVTDLLDDPLLDPCSGVAGIVCENGHIVGLMWEDVDMNMLHTDVGLLSELRQLTVSLNYIESVPSSICSCTNLLIFLLHSNLLSSLPDCISTLTKLTSFSVGYNNIKILPDLSKMNKLITILLANNQLESLSPTMFEKMNNLQEFNVGDNRIHSPVPNVSQCKKLRLFYIYGNLFYGHTDQNMFNQMQDLEYVDIESNMIEGSYQHLLRHQIYKKYTILFNL
jgi:Leucine-rich repeat (LRR) protein